MPSLLARKNKIGQIISYRAQIKLGVDPSTGKPKFATRTYPVDPNTKRKAENVKAEIYQKAVVWENEVKNNRVSVSKKLFGDYFRDVLDLKEQSGQCRITTMNRYRSMGDGILSTFGGRKITEITREQINKFYVELAKGNITGHKLSPKTIQNYHGLLYSVFESAVVDKLIPTNPANKAIIPKIVKHEMVPLEPEQIDAILQAIPKNKMYWQLAIRLAINTGLRRGELFGLRWDKVDFEKGVIVVSNNLLRNRETGELFEDNPKTESSVRTIEVPKDCLSFMKQYKSWQTEYLLLRGIQNTGLVFTTPDGKPMQPDSFTNFCNKLSKRLGFHFTPHLFRHTMGSMLVSNGVPISAVSHRLGHKNITTTLNVYTHTFKDDDRKCVDALEKTLKDNAV